VKEFKKNYVAFPEKGMIVFPPLLLGHLYISSMPVDGCA
jgi:hypothetical protein